jgi:hypothetical protein
MLGIIRRLRPGEAQELNPQPIPPGKRWGWFGRIRPGTAESLNPQPIPPGRLGEEQADELNPQPLPPRAQD